jgi:hypothetical protein
LYDLPKGASAQAEDRRHSGDSFISNQTGFDGLAILQNDDKGDHTFIRTIEKVYSLVWLMQAAMMWQFNEF